MISCTAFTGTALLRVGTEGVVASADVVWIAG